MRRIVLPIAAVLILLSLSIPGAAAQTTETPEPTETGKTLADCNPNAESYSSCLKQNTDAQDVLTWINQRPSELSKNQISAVYAYDLTNSSIESESQKINAWKTWVAGGDKPEWFGEQSSTTPTTETASSGNQSTEEINKYRQIRPGQWITEQPEFYDNGTGKITIYSQYDGKIAIVDNGDCDNVQGSCKPDVVNSDVSGGQTTQIWFEASVMTGTLSNGNQQVTLNSLTNSQGEYELAIMLLSDDDTELFGQPVWDYVWVAVVAATLTLAILALLTYAFIYIRNRTLEENLFQYLIENV
ncbi:hypothetical protein [Haloarcula amylolytica]|uniref:hypothetical protein n=1 Tax=Haloarcula amylolytica TaxID=396317 RepID=UPI003C746372